MMLHEAQYAFRNFHWNFSLKTFGKNSRRINLRTWTNSTEFTYGAKTHKFPFNI